MVPIAEAVLAELKHDNTKNKAEQNEGNLILDLLTFWMLLNRSHIDTLDCHVSLATLFQQMTIPFIIYQR